MSQLYYVGSGGRKIYEHRTNNLAIQMFVHRLLDNHKFCVQLVELEFTQECYREQRITIINSG